MPCSEECNYYYLKSAFINICKAAFILFIIGMICSCFWVDGRTAGYKRGLEDGEKIFRIK